MVSILRTDKLDIFELMNLKMLIVAFILTALLWVVI